MTNFSQQLRDIKVLEFVAQVSGVRSLKDRTVSVTIVLPETCAEQGAILTSWQNCETRVVMELTAREPSEEQDKAGPDDEKAKGLAKYFADAEKNAYIDK